MPHALLLTALLPFLSATVPQANAADEAARLVPSGAFLTVRVESVERLHAFVARIARLSGQDLSADASVLLADMDLPGDFAQIDLARPAYLALTLGGGSVVPTFVVPVRDATAYAASLTDEVDAYTAVLGGYVGVSQQAGYAAAAEANPFVTALRPGVASARVDLATLIRTYRPIIEMGLGQVEMMMDQAAVEADAAAAMDVGALLEVYMDGIWAFVDSADQLDLVIDYDGRVLQQRAWLTTLADSPMAEMGGDETFDLRPAAGQLDPDAGFGMIVACDMARTMARFKPMMELVLDAYPPELGGELERIMEAYEPILPLLGPYATITGDLGAGGMRIAYHLSSSDPAALSAAVGTQLSALAADAPSKSFAFRAPEEVELAGGRAMRAHMNVDVKAMTEGLLGEAELDPTELEQMQSMIDAIYGSGGLQVVWKPLADRVALALGGDEAFAAATLGAQPRAFESLPVELRDAISAASGGSMGLVYRVDYARLLGDMAPLFDGMGVEGLDELAGLNLRLPFTVWMGVGKTTWSGGVGVDLDQLGAVAEVMQATAASELLGEDEDER